MRRFLLIATCVFVLNNFLAAQNLCTNGDFNTYVTPPNSYAQICRATGWVSPSGICSIVSGTGSPDYYCTAGSGGAMPPATWWATVNPHSGSGMAGFATWYSSPNYREYIARQLSAPLVIGQTYQVTFWITNGVSWLHLVGTNNIGINFSATPLVQSLGSPIPVTPQLETSLVIYNTGWQQVSFSYTATAAYQYITIGNFHNDASTVKQSFGSGTYANYGAYYYIDDIVIQVATPLPVEVLSFEAVEEDQIIFLEWITASEHNSDYFDIERSENGFDFESIGRQKAQGNSSVPVTYHFTDEHPSAGNNYYRLKQVDIDGRYEYSKTILIRFPGPSREVHFQYDPADQKITLQSSCKNLNSCRVEINDLSGKVVYSSLIKSSEFGIDVSEIPHAFYVLTIYLEDEKQSFKLPLFR